MQSLFTNRKTTIYLLAKAVAVYYQRQAQCISHARSIEGNGMASITGIIPIDNVSIPIIVRGGIVSLIRIILDHLSKKRAEYMDSQENW